jgi:hypothetical protein
MAPISLRIEDAARIPVEKAGIEPAAATLARRAGYL